MSEDRSPKYGPTSSTQKPVRIACVELLRAMATIDRHHEIEAPAFERVHSTYMASVERAPSEARREL